jgi:flagellar hook assembly protein FlgD
LQDGDKNKDDLMIQILEFFNIQGVWTDVREGEPVSTINAGSYPNPFSDETVIRFETELESRITIGIFNINGQLVNSLFDSKVGPGSHEVRWDGSNNAGNRVAGGMYFYRLQSGDEMFTGKLIMME